MKNTVLLTFKELGLNNELQDGLEAIGFEAATPIQEMAIPVILEGEDLIACAQTGTGKTAAFLLPTIHKLTDNSSDSIDALILVPTRELAIQIDHQIMGLGYFTGVSSLAIYGGRDGASFVQERKALTMGANIVVATPGRLIAHLNMGYVKTNHLKYLILDEADRMLDMGFISDIKKIISFLPKNRQTLMFSATMPQKIRKFARSILTKPQQISLAVSKPAEGVLQAAYIVEDELKPKLLEHILQKDKTIDKRILIFCTTKANVKKVYATLRSVGLGVGEIHSDLDQKQREVTLRQFKNGNTPILVATDILSRGIDVKGINLVINYDVPNDPEDYIHRVGRTARADSSGVAMTLVNRKDSRKFKDIERFMEIPVKKLALPEYLQKRQDKISVAPKSSHRGGRGGGRGRGGSNRGGSSGSRSSNSRSSSGKRKWGGNKKKKSNPNSNSSGGQPRAPRPKNPRTND